MNPGKRPPNADEEISFLISRLHETGQRLEELTGGEVDTFADSEGRAFALRRAQESVRQSAGARQAAILDALPARIALLDAEGVVMSVNEGWRQFSEGSQLHGPSHGIGLHYATICHQATLEDSGSAEEAAGAIRSVLAGARSASIEYPGHSRADTRWFLMTASPLFAELRGGAVVMLFDITERKRGEDALRRNEEEFRAMFELASVGIAQADPTTGRLLRVNRKICEITGYSASEMLQVGVSELTHPDDRQEDEERFGRALRGESPDYRMEKRYIRKDGSIAWVNVNMTIIRDAALKPIRTMATIEDITDRKRSEQTAERALQRLTEAQRVGQIGDWEWDLLTQAISWSPQVFEILGRDPGLGPPQGITEHNAIYDEASRPVLMEGVAQAIATGDPQNYELRVHRANGERVDVLGRAAPRKDEQGRVVGLYGTVQDITQLKRSEAAARESDQRYHSLFENMFEGYAYCATVFEKDELKSFSYLEVNTAFKALTGLKDVVGKDVNEVIPGFSETGKDLLTLYGRVALTGRPEKCEAYLENLGLWLSITAYSSDRGHFVAVFDNITTRRQAEDALRNSAKELGVERTRLVMAQQVAKVGSWETDLSTGVVVWSAETHRIHETEPATYQPTHTAYAGFVHPDDRAPLEDAFAFSLDRRSPAVIEHRILLSGGRIKFVEQRWQVVVDGLGRPIRSVGTCQDITDRKIAEGKIIHLSRVQAMLSGISSLIVRVRTRDELLTEACRIAVDAGGFRMSLIAIVDPELERIVPVASAGKDEGLLSAVNSLLSEPELAPQTLVAQAIRQGKAIISNDSQDDPRVLLGPRYTESAVRSIAVLPLIIAEEAVGVLSLYSSEVEFFHEEEMKLLTELANDIAFGLSAIRAHAERERADDALRSSLKEKEALLKEVHHRVKNNMQVITSLLRLESNRIDHPTTRSVLKDMQNRIQAMAALHEAVYRSDNFSQVDLGAYLRQLTGQLGRSLVAVPGQISFHLDLFSVALDLDQAIPCGLIVNELVSNALKHAFPGGRVGEVRIELERVSAEQLRLRITDNGIGLPPDFDAVRAKSLGLQLVADLARQLGGSLQIGPGPEALFEVTFSPNHK